MKRKVGTALNTLVTVDRQRAFPYGPWVYEMHRWHSKLLINYGLHGMSWYTVYGFCLGKAGRGSALVWICCTVLFIHVCLKFMKVVHAWDKAGYAISICKFREVADRCKNPRSTVCQGDSIGKARKACCLCRFPNDWVIWNMPHMKHEAWEFLPSQSHPGQQLFQLLVQ